MKEKSYTLVLKSSMSEISKLEQFVDIISDEFNLGHTYFSNIIVALSELVKNAIIHGNKNDIDKKVQVFFQHHEGQLIFKVTDQGKGFDFPVPNVNDFNDNEYIKNGLLIVQSLSDKIEINSKGNTIKIYFEIASANQFLSQSRINVLKRTTSDVKKNKPLHES